MPPNTGPKAQPSMAALIGAIIDDTLDLIRQEAALARHDIRHEFARLRSTAPLWITALSLLLGAGVMFTFMLVEIVHQYVLPSCYWACYGVVGTLFVVTGTILAHSGYRKMKHGNVPPLKTVETVMQDRGVVAEGKAADQPASTTC